MSEYWKSISVGSLPRKYLHSVNSFPHNNLLWTVRVQRLAQGHEDERTRRLLPVTFANLFPEATKTLLQWAPCMLLLCFSDKGKSITSSFHPPPPHCLVSNTPVIQSERGSVSIIHAVLCVAGARTLHVRIWKAQERLLASPCTEIKTHRSVCEVNTLLPAENNTFDPAWERISKISLCCNIYTTDTLNSEVFRLHLIFYSFFLTGPSAEVYKMQQLEGNNHTFWTGKFSFSYSYSQPVTSPRCDSNISHEVMGVVVRQHAVTTSYC